jgi:hippurate hydrolase
VQVERKVWLLKMSEGLLKNELLKEELLKEADRLQEDIVADRRYLHKCPETGFDVGETLFYVKNRLKDMGYEPTECGKAGLIANVGGKNSGKTFLLRADMDALPMKEEADVEFSAKNGKMHACGHDMHTAMLLGAARILKKYEDKINGTVKLMFQSAEEIFEGSHDMIESGVLENPKVDAALMIHVMAGTMFKTGTVVVSAAGVSAPAADYFDITITGKGCHGSMPNMGVDPLNVAAHILVALQEINARELALNEQAVLTIGMFNGGTAPNVIPEVATIRGTIRTFDEDTRRFIKERIVNIAKGIAEAFRAETEVDFGSGCPTLVNDKDLSVETLKYMRELLGTENVFSVAELKDVSGGKKLSQTSGSEDFAYVSQEVPSIMLALAAGEVEKGYKYPQHHPMVKFDESVLSKGCAIYAYTAMRWLEDCDVQK